MVRLTRPSDGDSSEAVEAQRRMADALPILVMISDGDGTVNFFNHRWHEFTGQPATAQEIAENWQAYMHADDAPGVQRAWSEAVRRGDRVITMRYRLCHHGTGHYQWFTAQAVAVEDERGAIVQWIGAAVDIDDEVTAHGAMQRLLTTQKAVSGATGTTSSRCPARALRSRSATSPATACAPPW